MTREFFVKKLARYTLLILLAGCASSPDIVEIGHDTYLIELQARQYFHAEESQKTQAIRMASQHCSFQNKKIMVLTVQESRPPYTDENIEKVAIHFMCLNLNHP